MVLAQNLDPGESLTLTFGKQLPYKDLESQGHLLLGAFFLGSLSLLGAGRTSFSPLTPLPPSKEMRCVRDKALRFLLTSHILPAFDRELSNNLYFLAQHRGEYILS